MEKTTDYRYTAGRLRAALRIKKYTTKQLLSKINELEEKEKGKEFDEVNLRTTLEKMLDYLDGRERPTDAFIEKAATILEVPFEDLHTDGTVPLKIAMLEGEKDVSPETWELAEQHTKSEEQPEYLDEGIFTPL